jgi:Cd2+/Zn2+-exporting ATPase
MFEQTDANAAAEERWRFKVRGLDCQNEVRLLKEVLIPLVGDERLLSFQPKLGLLDVDIAPGITVEAVISAVSTTGMAAELEAVNASPEDEAGAGGCRSCAVGSVPDERGPSDRPDGVGIARLAS